MTVVNIPYPEWSQIVQALGLPVYYKTLTDLLQTGPDVFALRLYSGTVENQIRTLVDNITDHAAYVTAHATGAIEVQSFEEAQHGIIKNALPSLGEPRDPNTGSVVVQIQGGANAGPQPIPEKWAANNETVNTNWESVFSKSGSGSIWQALFQLNSDNFDFRVVVDGEVLFTIDIDDLHDNFGIKYSSGGDSNPSINLNVFQFREYGSRRWAWNPPEPIRFTTSLSLEFRSQGGNKKVVRGFSTWGLNS